MVSAFGALNLSSDAYSALMSTAQSVMNDANNGLIATGAAVGTMQNAVTQGIERHHLAAEHADHADRRRTKPSTPMTSRRR